ncbi:MAG: sulfatase family protein, partial [Solirubrobacteraceae bacterium]
MLACVRRLLPALLALLCLPGAASAAPPNVLVVETDDQTVADMAAMPRTRELIGERGVTFRNSVVSLSQCCPSRATLLTGQYAHNHGVLDVRRPFGGYDRLRGAETLPVWLQRAGYATAVVGKYLNGYGARDRFEVPPGWSEFHGLLGGETYRFYDYTLNSNGALHRFGGAPADYQTDMITDRAERLIGSMSSAPRPWFLWVTYVAPHVARPRDLMDPVALASTVPAPRHRNAFTGAAMPRGPAFDEPDVRDKPPAIRRRPRLGTALEAQLQETWRQRRAGLLAVDEGVARLLGKLGAAGTLDDTLIVFTSDNGYLLGEHRVPSGKVLPYEPSIRVPLLVRGPGIPRGVT